jgi:L-iditol 2-dehydrogenase
LPFEAAALVEPLACAVHGVEETDPQPGETVLVLGAGPLGLLLVRCAALAGARVLVVGRRENRLRAARELGAVDVLDERSDTDPVPWVRSHTGGRGADRVIEAVGQPAAWEQAIALVRKGGTVNLFGGCPAGTTISVDTSRLHYDALTLLGTFHHTPQTIRRALELLAEGKVPAELLIERRAQLDELPALLPELARGGGPLKVAVSARP